MTDTLIDDKVANVIKSVRGIVNKLNNNNNIALMSTRSIIEAVSNKQAGQMFQLYYVRVDVRPRFEALGFYPVCVKRHSLQKTSYEAKTSVKNAGGPIGNNPAVQNERWIDEANGVSYNSKTLNYSLRFPTSGVKSNAKTVVCGFLKLDGTFEEVKNENDFYAKVNEVYAPAGSYEVVQAFRKFVLLNENGGLKFEKKPSSIGFVVAVH